MAELSTLKDYFNQVRVDSDFTLFLTHLVDNNIVHYFHFVATGDFVFVKKTGEVVMMRSDRILLKVCSVVDIEMVKKTTKKHFSGELRYEEYCMELANCGIAKWIVDLNEMVRYFVSKQDERVHREKIII